MLHQQPCEALTLSDGALASHKMPRSIKKLTRVSPFGQFFHEMSAVLTWQSISGITNAGIWSALTEYGLR